ncbi:hypothetical protein [Saccharibacillus sp. O23]|uniref:hypothetical protein n=1 Tax=Saccharibacillus sp. O23 TaxID=2009338 RepID=UPI0015C65623|nr:hypothetical protein [Saccharibacillus sp. O23]
MNEDWPFEDPKNLAVITTRGIMERSESIKYVSHDEDDGGWQFHNGESVDEKEARIISLRQATILDPTLLELADLPLGWLAIRDNVHDEWKRIKKSNIEDQHLLFTLFHDGTLLDLVQQDKDYWMSIEIPYLAERIDPNFELFRIRLMQPHEIFYSDIESGRITEDPSEISRMELEIWNTDLKEGKIHIFCRNEENNDFGYLILAAEHIQIFDQAYNAVELSELKRIAQSYWDEKK